MTEKRRGGRETERERDADSKHRQTEKKKLDLAGFSVPVQDVQNLTGEKEITNLKKPSHIQYFLCI